MTSLPSTQHIPHSKLKDWSRELVHRCFIKKNGQRRYKYLVLGRDISYFVKHHCDSTKKFPENDIINMLEFLIDNIFGMFGWRVFQQTVGISLGTNCAPLLANLYAKIWFIDIQVLEFLMVQDYNFPQNSINICFHIIVSHCLSKLDVQMYCYSQIIL